jgi:hypothetical protein
MRRIRIRTIVIGFFCCLWVAAASQAQIVINEVRYNDTGPDDINFVELKGPAGTSLDGYTLDGVNGNGGAVYVSIDLSGQVIPDDGYFVVAQSAAVPNADLVTPDADFQNGPDNIVLNLNGTPVDALGYGDFSGGAVFVGEGSPAPTAVGDDVALVRCPDGSDTGDNSVDFWVNPVSPGVTNDPCATPTPAPTSTPSPLPTSTPFGTPSATPTAPPAPWVRINEFHYDDNSTDDMCFLELIGEPGTDLTGFTVVGVNGNVGDCSDEFAVISLDGWTIGATGFFVIAQNDTIPNYDMIDPAIDFQNGPDNVLLTFYGQVQDALGYEDFGPTQCNLSEGDSAPACYGDGFALGRCPDGHDTDNNAADFLCLDESPGAPNNCPPVTVTPTGSPAPPTVTPTPTEAPPTAPPTDTPTDTPTPTMTVGPGTPTYTPIPDTPTPLPSDTPLPSATPLPPTVTPLPSSTPLPTSTPRPTATPTATTGPGTPTYTPYPPTATPPPTSPPATQTPTPRPTQPCGTFGVTLEIATEYVSPGDTFWCNAYICNDTTSELTLPFVALLDIGTGDYWFYPKWKRYPPDFDYKPLQLSPGINVEPVLKSFVWPDTGSSSADGIYFHSAMLNQEMNEIKGEMDSVSFGYGPPR